MTKIRRNYAIFRLCKTSRGGGYILSFFADSAADLESISHGQKFVTKNGTDYGVPQAGSTVIVTSPNSGKTTYVMDAEGVWVVTEDISYSAVVANPSDAATAKLEKLKVNDTTYANWTENEIKSIASESGGKLYKYVAVLRINDYGAFYYTFYETKLLTKADIPQYLNTHTRQCEMVTTIGLSNEHPNTLVRGFWCSGGGTWILCLTLKDGVLGQTAPKINALPICLDLQVIEL